MHARLHRYRLIGLAISQIVALMCSHALAQSPAGRESDYPAKPVHLIVTFPPGGASDGVVRLLAPKLTERLAQPLVVENKAGAGGNVGLTALAQAPADGCTLAVAAAGGLAANVSLYPKLGFSPSKDFVAISLIAHIPFVLVAHPSIGAKDLADIIARSKAAPGALSVAHGGNGTAMHLSLQLLKQLTAINLNEIAYRGSGPAAIDVLGGQVSLALLDLPSAIAHIQAGKLKPLAVTGAKRAVFLPNVPTMAEAGVAGYESTGWFGFVAPAATPPAALKRLQTEITATLTDPKIIEGAKAIGVELSFTTPAEFERFIRTETLKWAEVIKTSGTRLE